VRKSSLTPALIRTQNMRVNSVKPYSSVKDVMMRQSERSTKITIKNSLSRLDEDVITAHTD